MVRAKSFLNRLSLKIKRDDHADTLMFTLLPDEDNEAGTQIAPGIRITQFQPIFYCKYVGSHKTEDLSFFFMIQNHVVKFPPCSCSLFSLSWFLCLTRLSSTLNI